MAHPSVHLAKAHSGISEQLAGLHQVFARAAIGDFSQDVAFPEEENDLTELYVGVQVMLEVIREKIQALESVNQALEQEVWERTTLVRELRARQAHLATAKAKDEALLNSIGEGIIATDEHGTIIRINQVAETMLRYKARDLLGKPMVQAIALRDENGQLIPAAQRPMSKVLKTRRKISSAFAQFIRADGTILPILFTTAPILQQTELLGTIVIFRDVTREKEIDRAKSEFVSLASHQLRTPLTAINWYIERLLAGKVGTVSKKQKVYLEEICRGSKRMAELVAELLNVSRLELGAFRVAPQPTDVRLVTQHVVREFTARIEKRQLKVSEKYSRQLPIVQVDPQLLSLILENLLDNAIKYTPLGGEINIHLCGADARGHSSRQQKPVCLRVSVTDTGYGIPENEHAYVFQKLFRAHNIKAKDTDGTGLGLFIVKSLLDCCDGQIWFDSKEDKGTTFTVLLPLTKSTELLKK